LDHDGHGKSFKNIEWSS